MSFFRLRTFNSSPAFAVAFPTTKRRVGVGFLLAVFFSTLFAGCFSGKNDGENVAAVSSPAVEKTTSDALQELQRLTVLNGKQNATVCFLGVSGKGNLGGLSEAARQQIETSSSFRLLEKSAVQAALKESDVRANNLFIPAERKKFVAALGEPVDYLLAGYVEKGSVPSDGANNSAAQNNDASENAKKQTVFKLELVELETNRKFEFVAPLGG
ncbi:MAG: hypothetical protein J6K25_01540 [Thermoguttaceae bacterium]|nr:hypothetical protein [Thermoguttaceae bacterium]